MTSTVTTPAVDQSPGIDLVLPTDNDAIFNGGGAEFYQHIERDYKGVKSTPWEGGQYGFVRDPLESGGGLVYTRFHEGIDIRPVQRDERGEPTDAVRAIASGKVVHINPVAGHSNYGRYIVIEHQWGGSSYYSLYGHLNSIQVQVGQTVARGQPIAVMGHTGVGINRERAHLHLELNLMLSHHFEAWYDANFRNDPNYNGMYNGLNLAGLDIARLYLALHKNPSLTIPEFLRGEEPVYKVSIPRSANFELPRKYPWMLAHDPGTRKESWLVSFAGSGVPIKIEPSPEAVTEPELRWTKKSEVDCSYLTRGVVSGHGTHAHLSDSGKRMMRLLIYPH